MQPSSVDVRLDNLFRVFNNTRYTHIDPAVRQDDLTSPSSRPPGEPFVLHPGEFVLGSTWNAASLPDDLAGRLEGKSSLGRLGLLTHSTAGFIDPGFRAHHPGAVQRGQPADHVVAGMKIGQFCLLRLTSAGRTSLRQRQGGVQISGPARPTPSRSYQNLIPLGARRVVSRVTRVGIAPPANPGCNNAATSGDEVLGWAALARWSVKQRVGASQQTTLEG